MKITARVIALALSLGLALVTPACGSDETSDTSSLIGGVAGAGGTRDCENFSLIGAGTFRCMAYTAFFNHPQFTGFNGTRFDTLFVVDEGFTDEQKTKLARALTHLDNEIVKNLSQMRRGQTADMVSCVVAAGVREVVPQRYQGDTAVRTTAAQMFDGLMYLMKFHKERGEPLRIQRVVENRQPNGNLLIGTVENTGGIGKYFGTVGTSQAGHFAMNAVAVDELTPAELAGTMFHELMHRLGYTHETRVANRSGTLGTLIKEAGLCIVSGTAAASSLSLTASKFETYID